MGKLKVVYDVDDVKAFSGLKDYFGHSIYLVINSTMEELRLYGKNPDYKKWRKYLDERKLGHVCTPEYLEVIDVSKNTAKFLAENFGGYKHTDFQVWG